MSVVIDSSILVAALLPDEPLAPQAVALMQQHAPRIRAPRLLKSEVTAVIRKAAHTKRLLPEVGQALLQRAFSVPIEFYESDALLMAAYEIATQLGHPRTYDSQYLALARRLGVALWTADQRLVNGAASQFDIHWLGNFR